MKNFIEAQRELKEDILGLSKSCLKEETKTHNAIYELNKKAYIRFKRKYSFIPNEVLLHLYTDSYLGKIVFKYPEMEDLDDVFRTYSNLTFLTALKNANLFKKKEDVFVERYPFCGIKSKSKLKLLYTAANPNQMMPPYADFVYICEYGSGKIMLDSHSHQIAH